MQAELQEHRGGVVPLQAACSHGGTQHDLGATGSSQDQREHVQGTAKHAEACRAVQQSGDCMIEC